MTTPVSSRPLVVSRAVARAPEHHAAASPASYKTALIHQAERLRQARAELASAKARGGDDRVRLARETVFGIYRELHALRDAVGPAKAAAWKLEGFDVEAAWATWGVPLPPLADLNRDERIAPIAGSGKLAFMGGSAVMAMLATMIVAVAALNGSIPLAPLVRFAEWFRFHKLIGLGVSAAAGFLAGGPLVELMNKLMGAKRGPDPIPD